ncbi:MAG: acyl-CoA dehydratase activase-related protein, partial [bacterium]
DLQPGELIIPEQHKLMSAIGVALYLLETDCTPVKLESLHLEQNSVEPVSTARKLIYSFPESKHYDETTASQCDLAEAVDGYLGVDVGSLSTNVVVIDDEGKVLSRRYLMTAGRPLEAVRKGISEVGAELEGRVNIKGCGTTGSGRYLVGDYLGADIIRNEITAQATAAIFIDPDVDTIFEIGGQDSKYIAIDQGVVIDFEMNKACAAGTGSFLQEQAEKLNIRIEGEFGDRALSASCPVGCGERCTVFMESDLVSHQQTGAKKDDLVAGLAYSIVKNYLTRVVCGRRIGSKVFFQGGVAWNKGVVAAFEMVTGQKVTVPPHHDVTGAIGSALLARNAGIEQSQFKGWDIWKRKYEIRSFVCEDCSNLCEIREVAVEGESPLYYGSRCEKYDSQGRHQESDVPNLFRSRDKLLFGSVHKPKPHARNAIKIGIPRTTLMYELLPFWSTMFTSLGYRVVLSNPTNAKIVEGGLEVSGAESCFPIKLAYGHVLNLVERKVDYIFLPSIIKVKDEDAGDFGDFVCPYIQSLPYAIRAGVEFAEDAPPLLNVPVHLRFQRQEMERELAPLRDELGLSRAELGHAIDAAIAAQREFQRQMQLIGAEVLENLPQDQPSLVVISRPYNGCDAKLSLEIPKRIRELGALAIPIDMLPQQTDESEYDDNMYWKYGRRILDACAQIRQNPNLYALYITNFGCGPDSFITHFFKEKMNGKPYLQIEVDEHSADAGVITRIEAFLDSLQGGDNAAVSKERGHNGNFETRRKVYVPQMCDHAYAFAAAIRACGGDAEALPATTTETMALGRKFTSGKECFPCILTTGDIMAKIEEPDFDRANSGFLMPSASGPCRFGQYNRFQRMVLDHNGYEDIPIYSPDSKNSYRDMGFVDDPGQFRKLGWQGMVATDVLHKLRCRIKPYEREGGQTESVYCKTLELLSEKLEEQADLAEVLHVCAEMFDTIPRDNGQRKPLIGVVGEIYLRQNTFANNRLIDLLESLGAEVALAPMAEWVFYTNFTYKRRLVKEHKFLELGKAILTDLYQRRIEHRFMHAATEVIPLEHDLPMEKLLELAYPYLHVSFSGEAILSIGKAIEYFNRGACGIINAMPFACMPGTIVTAISKKVRQDYDNLPWLNMSYEGLTGANEYTRLEAFVYQAERFRPALAAN